MLPHLTVLAALQAHALVPSDEVYQGIEPSRLQVWHDEEQGRLLQGPAWRLFTATDAPGWTARFDELTGRPRWAMGQGIPMPEGREAMIEAVASVLDRHHGLFGYEPGTLVLRSAAYDEIRDIWFVDFDTLRDGLPTWRGGIAARIVQGNLVYLQVETAPNAEVTGALRLGPSAAIAAAIQQSPAPGAKHTDTEARPVLLERTSLSGFELRKVYEVRSRTADPVGHWVSFVDGETGELLSVHNEVRFATGTVTARVHDRTVDGSPLITADMPLAVVRSSNDSALADENGDFTVNGSGPYRTDLNGDYVRVVDSANPEGSLSSNDPTGLQWTSGDAHQSQLDTYRFLHDVQAWGLAFAPNVSWVTDKFTATVNLNQVCNAYWDGNVNFFQSGGGCNNTGQIGDVIYHEWGHGFHYHSLLGGTFDGSVSEGAGDVVSTLQTLDRKMGPYFFVGGGAVRDLGPDHVYPRDIVGEVHEDGLIFGGAMYDLLGLLTDQEGEASAVAITSDIFAGLLES
ncbi:MAG: hypothetical protein KC621_34215, partial [Myxococcales bacterium]|nr:hypothetical protein [Myxococcales bacterium]